MEPGPCLQALNRGLRSFDPTKDYLVFPGGDPMSLGLAMIALQYNGVKSFQFLRWERERSIDGERLAGAGFYVPVRVSLVV